MWSIQDSPPRQRAGGKGRKESTEGQLEETQHWSYQGLRNRYFVMCQNNISKADKIPPEQCWTTGELCSPFLIKEHRPTIVPVLSPPRSLTQSQPGWEAQLESQPLTGLPVHSRPHLLPLPGSPGMILLDFQTVK